MGLLANPVPTSGEIRALRRRWGQHLPPLAPVTDSNCPVRVTADDAATGEVAGDGSAEFVRFVLNPRRRMQQLLTEPRVRRLLHAVAAAGTAGLNTLEQVSDETHDTVEENLARLSGWPRAMFEIARPPPPPS